MGDLLSISGSSSSSSSEPPATIHAPEIELGVGCEVVSRPSVDERTRNDARLAWDRMLASR